MDAQRKEYEAEKALLRNQAGSEALELKRRQDTRVSQTLREMEIERDAWRKKIVDKLRRESENAMDELRSHLQKKHRRQLENVDQVRFGGPRPTTDACRRIRLDFMNVHLADQTSGFLTQPTFAPSPLYHAVLAGPHGRNAPRSRTAPPR